MRRTSAGSGGVPRMYIARQGTVTAPVPTDSGGLAELFRYVMIVNPTLEVSLHDTEGVLMIL